MYQEDFILWTNNTHECNNLFDMWAILDAYIRRNKLIVPEGENILEGLAQRFLFDILTLQGDRHASNWSLIKNKNTYIEPIFHGGKSTTIYRSGTPALPFIVGLSKLIKIKYKK